MTPEEHAKAECEERRELDAMVEVLGVAPHVQNVAHWGALPSLIEHVQEEERR